VWVPLRPPVGRFVRPSVRWSAFVRPFVWVTPPPPVGRFPFLILAKSILCMSSTASAAVLSHKYVHIKAVRRRKGAPMKIPVSNILRSTHTHTHTPCRLTYKHAHAHTYTHAHTHAHAHTHDTRTQNETTDVHPHDSPCE